MKKRILSLLLAVCLCVGLLPVVALAAGGESLGVCTVDLSTSGYVNGVGITPSDSVSYDKDTNTLTLNNALLNFASELAVIKAVTSGTLTIELVGTNTITVNQPNLISGINVQKVNSSDANGGNLKITGNGSLTIAFDEEARKSAYGIFVTGDLTIDSGATVTVTGGAVKDERLESATTFSHGVSVGGNLLVSGTMTATGGPATKGKQLGSYGVYCKGNVTVKNGGTLNTNSSAVGYGEDTNEFAGAMGLQCDSNVTIEQGGKLTANVGTIDNYANASALGVRADQTLTVGGTLETTMGLAACQTGGASSHGVSVGDKLIVQSSGKVTGNGGTAKSAGDSVYSGATSRGVSASELTVAAGGELTGNGGAVTATGGNESTGYIDAASYGVLVFGSNGTLTVNGTLTGNGGAASAKGYAESYGVITLGNVTVSGSTAKLTAKCPDPQGGVSASSSEGSASSTGLMIFADTLTVSGGATVTAESGTATASENGDSYGLYTNGSILVNSGSELKATGGTAHTISVGIGVSGTADESITLNGGKLTATSGDATQFGYGVVSEGRINIKAGTAKFTGTSCGVYTKKTLHIGTDGKGVDFTAKATGTAANVMAAVVVTESLTLTNAQIVTPTGGKQGAKEINFGTESNPYLQTVQTILDTNNDVAMEVRIASGTPVTDDTGDSGDSGDSGSTDANDGTLPGWLTPVIGAANAPTFGDVKVGDWFYDAVRYVNEYGLMTGTSAYRFSPNAPVTRGMVMTILARREGIKTDRYSPWYAAGVEWAKSVGISDGTNPEEAITREQLAVMLYRYAQYKGYDLNKLAELAFIDAAEISDYATIGLRWAVGNGIMSGAAGLESGKLLPQSTATRAQLAAMLQRFFG